MAHSKHLRSILLLLLMGALMLAPAAALAQDNGKRQDGEGKYAELTALWWQWAYAQPADPNNDGAPNPLLDKTGANATVGQENGIGPGNKFFFLAGSSGFDAVRTVTVPRAKALFFPVINFEADNAVEPVTNYTVPQLRDIARQFVDSTTGNYASLDGAAVEIFRTKSPTFSYTMPAENSYYAYYGLIGPQFVGTIKPVVSDGYWAYIPPLAPGTYLVKFGGSGTYNGQPFSVNITYNLTVQ